VIPEKLRAAMTEDSIPEAIATFIAKPRPLARRAS
jgi:hypothetical protein